MDKYHLKCKNFKLKFLSFLFSKMVKNSESIAGRREGKGEENFIVFIAFSVPWGEGGKKKKAKGGKGTIETSVKKSRTCYMDNK